MLLVNKTKNAYKLKSRWNYDNIVCSSAVLSLSLVHCAQKEMQQFKIAEYES